MNTEKKSEKDIKSFILNKILELQAARAEQNEYNQRTALPWIYRIKLFLASAQFFAERWLLFYNHEVQQELMQKAGLPRGLEELLQASVGLMIPILNMLLML